MSSKKTALLLGVGFVTSLLLAQTSTPPAKPAEVVPKASGLAQTGSPTPKPVEVGTKTSGPGRFQIIQVDLPTSIPGGSTVIKIDTETGATWSIGQGNPQVNHSAYVWYKMNHMTMTANGTIYDPGP